MAYYNSEFGSGDVALFLLKENLLVLLSFAGVHYYIAWLGVLGRAGRLCALPNTHDVFQQKLPPPTLKQTIP